MTKSALFRTALWSILLALTLPALGQQTPAQIAEEEAVRRQEATILLRQLLAEGQAAQKQNDLRLAAQLYEEAYAKVQQVGVGIDAEKQATLAGMASVRLQLASAAQRKGDLAEADAQVSRVLVVDPGNVQAQAFKKANDKLMEQRKGMTPSKEVLARVPEVKAEQAEMGTVVQDGIVLYELGKLDEAEQKFQEAATKDPSNRAAAYYLRLVKEAKYTLETRNREVAAKQALVEVEQAWNPPLQGKLLPKANPFATTNLTHTGPGRELIFSKLHRIIIDELPSFDGLPLSEVIKYLEEESRKRDPDRRGINFIISSSLDSQAPPSPFGPPGLGGQFGPPIDPNTGQPILQSATQAEPLDVNSISIRLTLPLKNMRLLEILDALTMVAERPIKYSVNEYAVVISQKQLDALAGELHTRWYRVNPTAFLQGLESVSGLPIQLQTAGGQGGIGGGGGGFGGGGGGGIGGQGGVGIPVIPQVDVTGLSSGGGLGGGGGGFGGGGGGVGGAGGQTGVGLNFITRTNTTDTLQQMVRNFFTVAGVDLGGTNSLTGAVGKAVFYNDRAGLLYVRATMADLDIIESALWVLNQTPPQITIEAKFTEFSQTDSKALGFDWFLGNVMADGGRMAATGGSVPSFVGDPIVNSPGNPAGVFPNSGGLASQGPLPSDQRLTSGLRNFDGAGSTIAPLATFTGILTDPQFRVVVRAIEQRGGSDILSAPRVTTISGRQTQIRAVDYRTIVTSTSANQQTGGGGGAAALGGATPGVVGTVVQPLTQQLPFGPTLDLIPYVSADGYTIEMTIIPVHTEFLGYDDPGDFVVQAQGAAGNTVATPIRAQLPLPRLRVRQVITSTVVWDGQTVVLGGLISEDVNKFKDKVPMLGDLPWVGRLFRSESALLAKRNLVIFVTPTIIDPAGNRVHTDENLPYDPNIIPPQRPIER